MRTHSPIIAWLQLMRLPNVFTAVADVAMGYLVTHGRVESPAQFALLVAASCSLYLSGMVLNDVYDADVDATEQPIRPIPSGRIRWKAAASLGWALWASGVVIAWFASVATSDWRPGAVATSLATFVLLYDRVFKQTALAPLVMGGCRSLNVLMGMSLAPAAAEAASSNVEWASLAAWLIAAGIGVYILGVTVFARTDAHTSARGRLVGGCAVLLFGMLTLAAIPIVTNEHPQLAVSEQGWFVLWILLALITGRRCLAAIREPSPQTVQAAVRHCVQSIIVVDAAVCVGYASPFWGFAVLALIFPTLGLTAWLRAT